MALFKHAGIVTVFALLILSFGQQVSYADPNDPEINGTPLLQNYGFDWTQTVLTKCVPPDPVPTLTQDKDPQLWIVREGESIPPGGDVPCRIDPPSGPITEHSELVKQQPQWNGVHPGDDSDFLLKIEGTVEYKANVQQAYNPIVTNGVLTQQVQIHIPNDTTNYLQQIEIRRLPGNPYPDGSGAAGQAIKLRFTPEKTELLLAQGGPSFATITLGPGITKGEWHTFRIVAKKLSTSNTL